MIRISPALAVLAFAVVSTAHAAAVSYNVTIRRGGCPCPRGIPGAETGRVWPGQLTTPTHRRFG